MTIKITPLSHRFVVRLTGPDKLDFLQGLVTNDVRKVNATCPIYAALLTPQGRFLYDLFIIEGNNGEWLIDCENAADLMQRLTMFRLKRSVKIEDLSSQYTVYALWNNDSEQRLTDDSSRDLLINKFALHGENYQSQGQSQSANEPVIIGDPRCNYLGWRCYLPTQLSQGLNSDDLSYGEYEYRRIRLGVPDGGRDIPFQRGIILEYNFDSLGGIDWHKGCYIGQELMARTHHRGLLHKRLFTVEIRGARPQYGALIHDADGKEVGKIKTTAKSTIKSATNPELLGLALLRLEVLNNNKTPRLFADNSEIIVKQEFKKDY